MNDDFKSFYTAIILSAVVIFGVNYFMPKPVKQAPLPAKEIAVTPQAEAQSAGVAVNEDKPALSADEIMAQDTRLPLKNDVISGTIRLRGARFDNMTLDKYKQTIDEHSPHVTLRNMVGSLPIKI